jgi:hypothetical protein
VGRDSWHFFGTTRRDEIVDALGTAISPAYGPILELYLRRGGAALLSLLRQRTVTTVHREIDKVLQGC